MEKENKKKKKLSKSEFSFLIVNFLWMIAVYFFCIFIAERQGIILPYQICTGVYCAAAIILAAISAYLSGKIVSKKEGEGRTESQIALSRKLLLLVIPLIAVLLIDIVDLFVVEYFKQMLSTVL